MNRASIAAICCVFWSTGLVAQERETHYAISDPRNITEVISRVGPLTVTAQRFLLCYEFGPGFVKRRPDSRTLQLSYMINEQLLALGAYDRGLDTTRLVKDFVAEIEGDVATEELYKDDVLSKVRVSDAEIAAGTEMELRRLSVAWLFANSEADAQQLTATLSKGASFDSIFTAQNPDSASRSERSMETTRLKMSLSNPQFYGAIESLPARVSSRPIKGPDGYYIVRIADEWRSRIVGEAEVQKLQEEARNAITQHRADSLSDEYVRRIMESEKPVIQAKPFNLLVEWLAGKFIRPDDRSRWKIGLTTDEGQVEAHAADTLVTLRKRIFRMGDFVTWYRTREANIRLSRSSVGAFASSTQQLVWRMVRDRLLTAKALGRGLQKRTSVVSQKKWWEEKMLYELEKASLARTIPPDTTKGRRAYETELTKRILHRILSLKQKYPVSIDSSALRRLPVDEENQPRAIDVYAVKKGGIFPHQAFPTIDLFWQSWE